MNIFSTPVLRSITAEGGQRRQDAKTQIFGMYFPGLRAACSRFIGVAPLGESSSIRLLFPIPFVKMFGNGRAQKCVPLVDFPNRLAQTVNGGVFDEIAHRAGFGRLFDIFFITVRRKHEHFGGGGGFENLARRLQTIEQRHGKVHQNQCGTKFFDHGDRLMAVFRFADHFKVVFAFQNLSNIPTHERVVVRQQDSDSLHE